MNWSNLFLRVAVFTALMLNALLPAAQQAPSWSILASWTIPGKASGLAWDGTYIYFGIYGVNGEQIYKFNPANGTAVLQCSGPFGDAYGLTYKSPNLVTIDQPASSAQPAKATEFTMAGALVSQINLPNHYMSGIAWDNGNYWVCTYYPDPGTVYKVDGSGTVLSQFTPPANQPWDICTQGSDLWIADYNANMLYKVTNTGTVLMSQASSGQKPSGIVHDGTYLWYCDGPLGGNSTLYKVDPAGAGTPSIYLPVTSYNFGTVAVGSNATWNCTVQNTGSANLTITSIGIPSGQPVTTTFPTPTTITPGNSASIPFIYAPTSPGPLNCVVTINSNDPIHPQTSVILTGDAVYNGPHLVITIPSHDWGDRRAGAYSRWLLPISNNGNQPLTITQLDMTDPHFIIDESVVLPATVPTLATVQLPIWFHPEEGTVYQGELNIYSNDPSQNPFPVDLSGTGIDVLWPMGALLWSVQLPPSFDNSPKAIEPVQDITGDGIDEVIVASEDNFIRCFNGNASVEGDILWSHEVYAGSVYSQNGLVTISDINADGYRDVIAAMAWGDRSILALSGKTGQQIWKHYTNEYGDGGWVYQVDASYDYNNDGIPDVLASTGDDGQGTGPKRIYCLNGLTGLSIWETPCEGPLFSVAGVADFTGDGKPDVVAGGSNAGETQGKVYGIDGANGSVKWTIYVPGSSVWALMQIDDFTGDGIKDIASGDYSGNINFHNAVTGSKVLNRNIGNVLILRFENPGDLNGDGHPDILIGHSGTSCIVVNGFTAGILWSKPLADKCWNVANAGDVTWDGINDVIAGTLYSNNYAYFLNGISGSTLFSQPVGTPVDAINAIPDIVGDLTMEMVVGGRNGSLACFSGGYDPATGLGRQASEEEPFQVNLYPNPFSNSMNISFVLDQPAFVSVTLLDLSGRVLETVAEGNFPAGLHDIQAASSGSGISALEQGVYLIRFSSGNDVVYRKAVKH